MKPKPKPKRKSAKERVLDAHPLAECHDCSAGEEYGKHFDVTELGDGDAIVALGYGTSPRQAWADAASRLPSSTIEDDFLIKKMEKFE